MRKKVKFVCFGELLWEDSGQQTLPCGSPVNIGFHLNQLGCSVSISSCIDADKKGLDLIKFLESIGIDVHLIQVHPVNPDHKTEIEFKENNEVGYVYKDASEWKGIALEARMEEQVKQSHAIIFGIPALKNKKTEDTLFQLIDYETIKIMDINLDDYTGEEDIIKQLLTKSEIVKLKEKDLNIIANWYGCEGSLEEKTMKLYTKLGMEVLITTKGLNGACLVYDGKHYDHIGFKIDSTDPKGAEDAFLAGFLSSFFDDKDAEIALSEACAIGSFVATKYGSSPRYTLSEINASTSPQ